MKLINAIQTTLSLGMGPAESIQATPSSPIPPAPTPQCHLEPVYRTGEGREAGKRRGEGWRDGERKGRWVGV